jgi:hypothetical protein
MTVGRNALRLRGAIAFLQALARLLDVAVKDEQVIGVALRIGEVVLLAAVDREPQILLQVVAWNVPRSASPALNSRFADGCPAAPRSCRRILRTPAPRLGTLSAANRSPADSRDRFQSDRSQRTVPPGHESARLLSAGRCARRPNGVDRPPRGRRRPVRGRDRRRRGPGAYDRGPSLLRPRHAPGLFDTAGDPYAPSCGAARYRWHTRRPGLTRVTRRSCQN